MEVSIDPVAGIEWLAGLFPVRAPRRGSLTVMFTDIAGFTAYAATCGDPAAAPPVHPHGAAAPPAIPPLPGPTLKPPRAGLNAPVPPPPPALPVRPPVVPGVR